MSGGGWWDTARMTTSRELIAARLAGDPAQARAAMHDPLFAASLHQLGGMLDRLDALLGDEGLDEAARERVKARLVADSLPRTADIDRLRDLAAATVTIPLPADLA
ncbi:hypothetical protein OV450_1369 [Actinobacteria bacterium OV450]|nr:hypothetical protein OV450_1369 [Actinobacteria bacterium OV450]